MTHVILLGDSIFDNAPYVKEGHSVIELLKDDLPKHAKATLLAVDGDVTLDVMDQIKKMPEDLTSIALSVGGNDALTSVGTLMQPLTAMPEALDRLIEARDKFKTDYCAVLDVLMKRTLTLSVCTIYDQVPNMDKGLLGALAYFNDVITREAYARGLHLIDLRVLCNEAEDYSSISSIEPSEIGAAKIANALANFALLTPPRLI